MNKQEKKQKLTGTDNSMVVTRRKGVGGIIKDKGGQLFGDGRRLDFGW